MVALVSLQPACDQSSQGDGEPPGEPGVERCPCGSFGSPLAARTASALDEIVETHRGRVRWVHRTFLDRRDERALSAAVIAAAARKRGRFWKVHDALFAAEGRLSDDALFRAMEAAGLEPDRLPSLRAERELLRAVKRDVDAAKRTGVESPATVFVNGRYASGTFGEQEIGALVQEELAAGGTSG
ncbi:MAG: DsbA family protein [Myxococcota bacterium]